MLGFHDLSADPTVEEAASVAAYAIDGIDENGTIDEVFVVYNHSKNAAEQVPRTELVLPVDTAALDAELAAEGVQQEAGEAKLEGDVVPSSPAPRPSSTACCRRMCARRCTMRSSTRPLPSRARAATP